MFFQVWTKGDDPEIQGLLKKGYKLIISNYDALYFDCGFGAWVGDGNSLFHFFDVTLENNSTYIYIYSLVKSSTCSDKMKLLDWKF